MCTSEEMVVTTTSITAVKASTRSIHSECRSAKEIKENIGMRASWPTIPTSNRANQDSTQEITRKVDVMSSESSEPAADGACSGASTSVLAKAACSACGAGAARARCSATDGAA